MIIYVDVDGVVAASHVNWLRLYNEEYGDHLTEEQITAWSIHKFVKPRCGTKVYDYLKDPKFYYGVDEIPGAFDGIQYLRNNGFTPIFLTSGIYRSKYDWLRGHAFVLDESEIVVARNKSLLRPAPIVDDYEENLRQFGVNRILFSQPWNANAPKETFDYRVDGWNQLIALLADKYL